MRHDTIIVGGGYAGLAAATYLGRARRHVRVLDTGRPRNRFAAASHGFLGQDGVDPGRILAVARGQLGTYPTADIIRDEAVSAYPQDDGFGVRLASGSELEARTLILAFGLTDTIPAIPGLNERWGRSVLHCPYCHAFEFSDRALGVLFRTEMSAHQATLIAEWGPTTLFLNGHHLGEKEAEMLDRRGVTIEPERVTRLEGDGDALSRIRLDSGGHRKIEALFVSPESQFSSPIAAQLGLTIEHGMLGPRILTDADKETGVRGIYAAGDIARAPHNVSWAVADGVTAAMSAHRALVFGQRGHGDD